MPNRKNIESSKTLCACVCYCVEGKEEGYVQNVNYVRALTDCIIRSTAILHLTAIAMVNF